MELTKKWSEAERWQAYNEAQSALIPPDEERCPADVGGIHGRCVLRDGHDGDHRSRGIVGMMDIPDDWMPADDWVSPDQRATSRMELTDG